MFEFLAIIAYLIAGAIVGVVLVFFGTFLLAKLDADPTGQGAWAASLFFTIPVAAIVGAIAGYILPAWFMTACLIVFSFLMLPLFPLLFAFEYWKWPDDKR